MLLVLCAWLALAGPAPGAEVRLWRAPAAYDVDSTVLLNDAARRDKEVGYKLRARLALLPVWRDPQDADDVLLRFELEAPQLLGRGKHPNAEYAALASLWDERPRSAFYARWRRGRVLAAYLDPADHRDVLNFKRSLISLFQFHVLEGWGNETDASGECEVHYESPSPTTVRKTKRRCRAPAWALADDDEEDDSDDEDEVQSRRLTRYSLSAALDALLELHAEELHALGEPVAGAGLKARAYMRLTLAPAPPAAPQLAASLSAALAALPAALQPAPLPATPPPDLRDDLSAHDEPLGDDELGALAEQAAGAEPGHGGTPSAARAVHVLRGVPVERLARLLHDAQPPARLAGLCAALGLRGSAPAHAAAVAFLRLRERDAPHHLAHAYFAALAHAPRPHAAALDDALRLADELRDADLAESALLAAAAAAQRAPRAAQSRVRDALARALRQCADDECRRVRVAALGNLRRADAADPLLTHAEGGGEAALEALDALDALLTARGALPDAALGRLERVALGGTGAALEARAAALDLLLRAAAPAPFSLPRVLLALQAAREHELLRLAWRRLGALGAAHEPVRLLLRLLPARLRGWDGAAAAGTSALLERAAGGAAGWTARLESRQLARGALLRRGRVRLLAVSPRNATDDTLSVELWTRGLDALAGAADDARAEEEEASGGLVLRVGGARLRALTLFRGQAELLAHVWAGTASEPVPALRAARPLPGAARALPLLGGAALRYERAATAAAALDADAQVSLWSRTARSRLALRTALVARGAARVRAAWGALEARAASELAPRLRIDVDLDFYAAPALCVRAAVAPHERVRNVTLESRLGAAARRVRRTRAERWPAEGRTLALGAPNDATCRAMGAARD